MLLRNNNLYVLLTVILTMTTMHGMENHYTWNNASIDIKKGTLALVEDRGIKAMSCTDKSNFKFVQERIVSERTLAARQRKVVMLELLAPRLSPNPFVGHLSLEKAIDTLKFNNGIEYTLPGPFLTSQNDVCNIAWNRRNSAIHAPDMCAFVASKSISSTRPLLVCATLQTSNTITYRTMPIGIGCYDRHILSKPYFIETTAGTTFAAILSFEKNQEIALETRLRSGADNTSHSLIELDNEDGSLPRSLHRLRLFPYLTEQCVRAAHRSARETEPEELICSLSTIKLHGFPISNDYKEKIRMILVHKGIMPFMENLSTEEQLSWERFKHACS